jgi:hypothetical protein
VLTTLPPMTPQRCDLRREEAERELASLWTLRLELAEYHVRVAARPGRAAKLTKHYPGSLSGPGVESGNRLDVLLALLGLASSNKPSNKISCLSSCC